MSPEPTTPTPPGAYTALRAALALRWAAEMAGRNAAGWWGQDHVGGRTTGDIRPVATRVLAGLDAGDPAVLDALPQPEPDATEVLWADIIMTGTPPWSALSQADRDQFSDTYADGFFDGMTERVAELCRDVL